MQRCSITINQCSIIDYCPLDNGQKRTRRWNSCCTVLTSHGSSCCFKSRVNDTIAASRGYLWNDSAAKSAQKQRSLAIVELLNFVALHLRNLRRNDVSWRAVVKVEGCSLPAGGASQLVLVCRKGNTLILMEKRLHFFSFFMYTVTNAQIEHVCLQICIVNWDYTSYFLCSYTTIQMCYHILIHVNSSQKYVYSLKAEEEHLKPVVLKEALACNNMSTIENKKITCEKTVWMNNRVELLLWVILE